MARFVVLVIDSFGVGAMKDVTLVRPQDAGANTCGHILSQLPHLQLPTLEKLGLINALGYAPGDMQPSDSATWGVAELQHEGGDTFMGHQEILGTRPLPPLRMPFRDVIGRVEQALVSAGWQVERRGDDLQFLWVNQAVAIGDNLEADLGQVYNITANLSVISFDDAIKIGRIVREQVQVGRVITFGGLLNDSKAFSMPQKAKKGALLVSMRRVLALMTTASRSCIWATVLMKKCRCRKNCMRRACQPCWWVRWQISSTILMA